MICQHCGHPVREHERWGGNSDTRGMLAEVARFCRDCTHPTCLTAVEIDGGKVGA